MKAEDELEALGSITRYIVQKCVADKTNPEELFGSVIRTAIDEVVDGPRTGRWSLDQLADPEKTYVGMKVEIIVRASLGLRPSVSQDAEIAGLHVNIKWSKSLAWMIGPENVDAFCLGLGTDRTGKNFSVGVFRATNARLNAGGNRDKKRTLSKKSFEHEVAWLVREAPLPRNFIEELPAAIRTAVFAETSAQSRVRKLITLVQRTPIPRDAFYVVALDKRDPMRRLRKDKYRKNPLGGMVLLNNNDRAELRRRGITDLPKDHFISMPEKE